MKLLITRLLYDGIIWNKEQVVIMYDGKQSEMKRLEFQYDALDNDYNVYAIEPLYDEKSETPYLVLYCD